MDKVFAKPGTKASKDYMRMLALDLLGEDRFEEDAPWFEHGKKYEGQARMAWEWKHGIHTWNDAFLVHDDFDWLGCSPDLLTGPETAPESGGEIKCRKTLDSYLSAKNASGGRYGGLTRGYYLQIQCCLGITGFESWRYLNYYINEDRGEQKLSEREVLRDESTIDEILERSAAFRKATLELAMEMRDE